MLKIKARLLLQFSIIYFLAALIGTILLTVNNVFLNHSSFSNLLKFNIPAVLAGDLVVLIVLLILSGIQLRRLRTGQELQIGLMRLPSLMFIHLLVISAILSCVYHYLQFGFEGVSLSRLSERQLLVLAKNLIAEQTIALVIGTLQYALSRKVVRPHIIHVGSIELAPGQSTTFVRPLTVASISCIFITGSVGIEYFVWNEAGRIDVLSMAIATGIRFLFAIGIFYLLVIEMRGDLRSILASVGALLEGKVSSLHKPVPVVASDEIGELTGSFNALQRKMAKGYDEVRQELALAYNVQQQLLPHTFKKRDGFEIAAVSIPSKEVGGDLFDFVEFNDGGFAVMIGDVSGKGIPAAMLMTAALALFRSEIRKGRSPGEVLERLNVQFADTLQGNMYITMGIGCWEPVTGFWRYASAGHVSPYLIRERGTPEALACCSLPLGIDADEAYKDLEVKLEAGDRLVLYSDGVVECETDEGELYGFDSFERAIQGMDQAETHMQLQELMQKLPKPSNGRYDDDRTIMLIQLSGKSADSLTVRSQLPGGIVVGTV